MSTETLIPSWPEVTGQPIESVLSEVWIDVKNKKTQKLLESISKDKSLEDEVRRVLQIVWINPAEILRFQDIYIEWATEARLKDGRILDFRTILSEENKWNKNIKEDIDDDKTYDLYTQWHKIIIANKDSFNQKISTIASWKITDAVAAEKTAVAAEKTAVAALEKLNIDCKDLNWTIVKTLNQEGKDSVNNDVNRIKSKAAGLRSDEIWNTPIISSLWKKGITPEMIQSGKYDSIIQSYIILENQVSLQQYVEKGKEKEFSSTIDTLRLNLWEPFPARVAAAKIVSDRIILEPNREKVTGRLESLVSTGDYKTMSWDRDTREIRLEAKDWSTRIIDTARIPPYERIMKNGLSIEQSIPDETKESREYKKQKIEVRDTRAKNEDEIWNFSWKLSQIQLDKDNPLIKWKDTSSLGLFERRNEYYGKIRTPEWSNEDKIKSIWILLDINAVLKRKNLDQLLTDMSIDPSTLNKQLEEETMWLTKLQKWLNNRLDLEWKDKRNEQKKPKELNNDFESIAQSNLSFLIDLGYDKLGQSTLEAVTESLNREHKWIGGTDYIDLSRETLDMWQKQRILLALTRIMHTTGKWLMPEWDQVSNSDPIIGYRQTRSPLWWTSLIELWKQYQYRRMVQNTDKSRFQNIIAWREQPVS